MNTGTGTHSGNYRYLGFCYMAMQHPRPCAHWRSGRSMQPPPARDSYGGGDASAGPGAGSIWTSARVACMCKCLCICPGMLACAAQPRHAVDDLNVPSAMQLRSSHHHGKVTTAACVGGLPTARGLIMLFLRPPKGTAGGGKNPSVVVVLKILRRRPGAL